MKVVTIIAPYSSVSKDLREDITKAVEAAAMLLWENGVAVIAPHLNSGGFADHTTTESPNYRLGYAELIERSDAVLYMFRSPDSHAYNEAKYAHFDLGKPLFYSAQTCLHWAAGGNQNGTEPSKTPSRQSSQLKRTCKR